MKQPLNEEFSRMQKLAGVINEEILNETDYKGNNNLLLLDIAKKLNIAYDNEDWGAVGEILQDLIDSRFLNPFD